MTTTDRPLRFDGKVALLTGAASGIGRSVALRLASEGATVFGVDINAEGLDETAASVAEAGGTMVVRPADITGRDECRATVAACLDDLGRLDVLGNIAGMARAEHVVDVDEDVLPPDDGGQRRRRRSSWPRPPSRTCSSRAATS